MSGSIRIYTSNATGVSIGFALAVNTPYALTYYNTAGPSGNNHSSIQSLHFL